jgi:RNA methyltransferase, TrmH family
VPAKEQQHRTNVGPGHVLVRRYLDGRRRPRRDDPIVAVEGLWALERALAAERTTVEAVFVCPELVRGDDTWTALARAEAGGAEVLVVSPRLVERMVDRDGPDGVASLVHLPVWSTADVLADGVAGTMLVLDGIEKPGNLGTVIRCADGAGVAGVVLTGGSVRRTHPQAIKASMGTVFTMPVVEASVPDVVGWARRGDVRLLAADPGAARHYRAACYRGPLAIVLGSERRGLSAAWRGSVDEAVSIPMLGTADSLNVGHAAALLLYEALAAGRGA